jgi:gamma-glutamyl:cysteine ligase YbdK (ATP-grasp superfamily)
VIFPRRHPYRLFEVTGIELEYAVVDRALNPRCLVEEAFRRICGRPTSEFEHRQAGFSNELAAHVLEIKTPRPRPNLTQAETDLADGVRFLTGVLREQFDARLLPTAMHPFMRPSDTTLWRRAGRRIYETYARIFPVHRHGWVNVQCSHVNLPFGTEQQTVALHNSIACLLPYLPALSASSPIYEGKLGPSVDNRLAFYRINQAKIPEIAGEVIPEFMTSYRQYRHEILAPMYRTLRRIRGGGVLAHEWVNSRGAIPRFGRRAVEIRTLDTQECVKMDIAIAVFIRGALKWMVRQLRQGSLVVPEHAMLVQDFAEVVARGSRARIHAAHLRPPADRRGGITTPRKVLLRLLEYAAQETRESEACYLALVEARIRDGNLSERIARAVKRTGGKTHSRRAAAIRGVYGDLVECLENNTPWPG